MAEENKSPEVEIDTDGVNEETVNVDAPEVSNEAFEKKQDVDLGYTDVTGGKTAKELLKESKEEPKQEVQIEEKQEKKTQSDEEGLEEYSEKVKKRISKLTFQVRELNDDEVISTISNPADILHHY